MRESKEVVHAKKKKQTNKQTKKKKKPRNLGVKTYTRQTIKQVRRSGPRWWRNRTGRPFSPSQTHQKIICMWSNSHRTTSEHWKRTPDTQKGKAISLEWGRMKDKDRKRDNIFGDSDPSWGWHHEGGEISTQQGTLPQKVSVGSLGTSEGSITEKINK